MFEVVASGQAIPSNEYIKVGDRTIAVERYQAASQGQVKVDVWPSSANLGPNQQVRFNSVIVGSSNNSVVWTISPNLGSINTATGVYTAPPTPPPGQSVVVRAQSVADPTKSATAIVDFYAPSINGAYPLTGSFLNFYRNLGVNQWGIELSKMNEIDMKTVVIVAVGGLRVNSGDPLGYSLSGVGFLYPSDLIPVAERPSTDRLETILALADQKQMRVYLGSLQTYGDWTSGLEFTALREWNKRVAEEVISRYGHHPSLEGWYFTQELWMNWVKYYTSLNGSYYGTTLLKNYIDDMKVIDPTKPVSAAVVFKKTLGSNTALWLNPSELQSTTQAFLQATGLQILMPQDGGGAEEGAPPISELGSYFAGLKSAADAAGTGTALWSTVETFQQVTGLDNARFPPGSSARIQQQVNNVRPYVTGMVNWIYGNDMSDQATYYPVRASNLDREYRYVFRPASNPRQDVHLLSSYQYSVTPDPNRPDGANKLANRDGGGFDGYLLTDWVGHPDSSTGGIVRVTADLGAVKQISRVRALSLSMFSAGIRHPASMTVEVSSDGVQYTSVGSAGSQWQNTDDFSVGWTVVSSAVNARYIRCSFSHTWWMFLSEIEVLGAPYVPPPPPASIGISIDPGSVSLAANGTQQFIATVTNSVNTAVVWSVNQGDGTVNGGLYTAPPSVPSPRSILVKATLVADPTKSATAVVTLQPAVGQGGMTGTVNPSDGAGSSSVFTFEANALGGSVREVVFLMHETLASGANACWVQFNPNINTLFLSKDSGNWDWEDWDIIGTSGRKLNNSQCEVDLGNSSSTIYANRVEVRLSIRFKPGFSGTKHIYMTASDTAGNIDVWRYKGYWIVP